MIYQNIILENYESDNTIIEECKKKILWYKDKSKKKYSIVYFHGFGSSSMEVSGFNEYLVENLEANCFLSRLKYHGMQNNYEYLKKVKFEEWIQDIEEGIQIGLSIGEKLIIIAHSFSSVLLTHYLSKVDFIENIYLVIFTSPSLVFNFPFNFLINKFSGLLLLKLFIGKERNLKIDNKSIEKYWTIRQPIQAILQIALITNKLNTKKINFDYRLAVFYYCNDKIINIKKVIKFITKLKSKKIKIIYSYPKANRHTFTGNLLQPETISDLSKKIQELINSISKYHL